MGIFTAILNIFTHISTHFHVYFFLFLHIYHIFLPIFMYIYTYFHVYFYLFLHIYTYIYHKSVVFYNRLPQKCVVLLQIATKVWYFTTVYRYLPHKCGILLQFDTKVCYFTDTSKVRCFIKSTSNTSSEVQKVAVRKIHKSVAYLEKKFEKFDYPHFFSLIYRSG